MSTLLVTIGCIWLAAALLLVLSAPRTRIDILTCSCMRSSAAEQEKFRTALESVMVATLLTGLRTAIGMLTGSLSIFAAAADSGLDLLATIVTWLAIRFSSKPPDESHLYGHGKAENLSALVEALLMTAAGAGITYAAVQSLFLENAAVDASIWAFLIMGLSMAVDTHRSRELFSAAGRHKSQALEADALRLRSHVWSAVVVILGLFCVKLTDWVPEWGVLRKADPVAALLMAGIFAVAGLRLGFAAIQALLDAAPEGVTDSIRRALAPLTGIVLSDPVKVRRCGSHMFVDARAIMSGHLTLCEAHKLTNEIEARIHALLPDAEVTIHAEPDRTESYQRGAES